MGISIHHRLFVLGVDYMSETQTLPEHPAFRIKHAGYLTFEKVIITLAVATLVELSISLLLEGGTLPLEIAALCLIVIAIFKGTLIVGFFMHLFYERKPLIIALLGFVAPMLVGLPVALVILSL